MAKRVYIETSIPSFCHEIRPEPEMVARRNWTRRWWDSERQKYELVSSLAVVEELLEGMHPNQAAKVDMISGLPFLRIDAAVEGIAKEYVERYLMPREMRGDAMHLALASYYNCHFLLTWNCVHLANANKFEHIRHVNATLGLFVPALVTPIELLAWEGE